MRRCVKIKVDRETKQGTILSVLAPDESITDECLKYAVNGVMEGELRIDDGRGIRVDQRRRIYATIRDIADSEGYAPEELKELMKYRYIAETGGKYFSLSDCSITTAREFLNCLLDFALWWGIPLTDTLIDRTDDISSAMYSALVNRRCVVCGQGGECHHIDRVGAGRSRNDICHLGMRVMCLCREHHNEAHTKGQNTFNEKYHVCGINADEKICDVYRLTKRKRKS